MNDKTKLKNYLIEILKKHPKIKSGRKNFEAMDLRIRKTKKIITKYFKKDYK